MVWTQQRFPLGVHQHYGQTFGAATTNGTRPPLGKRGGEPDQTVALVTRQHEPERWGRLADGRLVQDGPAGVGQIRWTAGCEREGEGHTSSVERQFYMSSIFAVGFSMCRQRSE